MTLERVNLRELEVKNEWLKNLAQFIVIANGKTWAGDGAEVDPRRPGYKRLQWPYPDEKMTEDGILTFKQAGIVALVIRKDQNRKPLLPWNF